METEPKMCPTTETSLETVPSLIEYMAANEVAGFDSMTEMIELHSEDSVDEIQSCSPSIMEIELAPSASMHSVSLSMPSTPDARRVLFRETLDDSVIDSVQSSSPTSRFPCWKKPKISKFHSHWMPKGAAVDKVASSLPGQPSRDKRTYRLEDQRYDSFKTWSGKFERQLTIGGRCKDLSQESDIQPPPEMETLPFDRYF